MKVRVLSALLLGLALGVAATAQDDSPGQAVPQQGPGGSSWQGQRGGGRGMGGGMGMARGLMGTVTEAAADHYTIRTDTGETYTVHFSANTRILKQGAGRGMGGGQGEGGGRGMGGNPPQPIKAGDIKVGDAIGAMGAVDAESKSVGAITIVQMDPERARQMQEMQANFGKTWLMGRVTAIDGVKITLLGNVDQAAHSFVADENTDFRKRREPVTLADIQVGDVVRVEGAVKGGTFVAATVMAMGMPPGGTPSVPRNAPPPPQ
jgi:hypothetical protein